MEAPDGVTRDEGLSLLKAGRIDEAIGVLGKAVAADPSDAVAHMYMGIACHQAGDGPRAARHLEESIRLQESPRAYYNLGQVYESLSRLEDALAHYRRALVLDPNYAKAQEAIQRMESRTAPSPDEPSAEIAKTASGVPVGGPYAPPPVGGESGPPPWLARQIEEQRKIAEQQRLMMKSGLIYGAVCGPLVALFMCVVGTYFGFAPVAVWSFLGVVIVIAGGAVYGGIIGFWVGLTCGGEDAGLLAGAVLGGAAGLVIGLVTGAGVLSLVYAVCFALASGAAGYFLGQMVDASIGQV